MALFEFPAGLELVAHFSLPTVRTWGTKQDQEFKSRLREAADLSAQASMSYTWYAFAIRCVFAPSRLLVPRQVPDVENIPKLVIDAFTGVLYPDDNIQYVRGVQVEAAIGSGPQESTEVWIFGKPGKLNS